MHIFLFHLHLHFSNSYVCEQLYAITPLPTYVYVYLQIYLHISTLMYMDPSLSFLCIYIPILVRTYWPVLGHTYKPVSIPLLLLIPMSLFQYLSVFTFPVRALHTYQYSSAWIYLPLFCMPPFVPISTCINVSRGKASSVFLSFFLSFERES